MPPPQASARSGSFRSRKNLSSLSQQPYMPVHESIPEEDDRPPRYRDDDLEDDTASLLASSDDSELEDDDAVKLRRRSSSKSKSKAKAKDKAKTPAPAHASAYVPVVRNSGDIETYLDSITEAEQELLSASRYDHDDLEQEDYLGVAHSDSDGDGNGYYPKDQEQRHKTAEKQRLRKKLGARPLGWRAYWYSRTWCRALVAVVVLLVLLVLGFVSFARYRKAKPAYYVSLPRNLCVRLCMCLLMDSPWSLLTTGIRPLEEGQSNRGRTAISRLGIWCAT